MRLSRQKIKERGKRSIFDWHEKEKDPMSYLKNGGVNPDKKRGQGRDRLDCDEERVDSVNNSVSPFRCHFGE